MESEIIITLIIVIACVLVAILWIVANLTSNTAIDKIADASRNGLQTVLDAMGKEKAADAIGALPDSVSVATETDTTETDTATAEETET